MRWFGLALLALLGAAPASATETRLVLDYDLTYGPFRLVALRATVDLDDRRYRAATDMHTVGLAGILFPWESHAHSAGVQAAGGPRPERFSSEGVFRGQPRHVEIDYGADGIVKAHVEPPPEEDWRDQVPQELVGGTIDPLSASLSVMSRDCSGTVPVFDGRRRYDLTLTDMGADSVEGSGQAFSGPARRCRAQVRALAGFWKTEPQQSEAPTTLDFWVAQPTAGSPPVPVYLELSGNRGTLRIHLINSQAPALS